MTRLKCECKKVFWLLAIISLVMFGIYIWEETHLTADLTDIDAVVETKWGTWYLKPKEIE